MTTTQLETIIDVKIKVVIASKLEGKFISGVSSQLSIILCRILKIIQYPSLTPLLMMAIISNSQLNLKQLVATLGAQNIDAQLFHQFVSNLARDAFECYIELPNDLIKTFPEFKMSFVKRFTSAIEKIIIVDLALEKQKRDGSIYHARMKSKYEV